MRTYWQAVAVGLLLLVGGSTARASDSADGKALLEKNCSRCHALSATSTSPLQEAPNLWIVLRSYPQERLEVELGEGIGSRHKAMPQVPFSAAEINSIEHYLFDGD